MRPTSKLAAAGRRILAASLALSLAGALVVTAGPVVEASRALPAAAAAPGQQSTVPTGAATFVPLSPRRIVDTRRADIGPVGPVTAGSSVTIDVGELGLEIGGTPTAIAVTITAVDSVSGGYVTAWPTGSARPEVSNLNVDDPGPAVANMAIVPLGDGGRVSIYASMATHLLVDLSGVYVAVSGAAGTATSGRTLAVTPARLLDTRGGAKPADHSVFEVAVGGVAGVPAGAAAALITVTAVDAAATSYVTLWPTGTTRPEVSSVNLGSGQTAADLAIVPLGDGGRISVYTDSAAHLLVDVVGYVTGAGAAVSSAGLFVASGPSRVLDTRQPGGRGTLLGRTRADLTLPLPSGVRAAEVGIVAANLTLTQTSAPMYLTAYPARTARPETSNVNASAPGSTVAAFGLVPVGPVATISLYPQARTEAIVDVAGFFLGTPAAADPLVAPVAPTAQGSPPIAAFDEVIDGFLGLFQLAGASVAVAKDGRIVYARAYGTADEATGEPMRVEHHFRFASISKMLTGATIMRLAGRGLLRLDDPVWPLVGAAVPLPAGADGRLRAITIRDLLGHTSGIPAYPDPFFDDEASVLAAFGPPGPTSCPAAARWAVARPLSWDPGTHYSYSNLNFCLLGLVIEAVTGRPWSDVVRDEVQVPRGVLDMYTGATYTRAPLDVAHRTPGLNERGGGWFMESIGAAGAWMGTPVDAVRIVDGLDPNKPGAHLLGYAQLAQMRARPATARGEGGAWYGLALINFDDGAAFGHSGALEGSRTLVVHDTDGLSWSIMVNGKFADHAAVLSAVMRSALATVPPGEWPTYDLSPDLP